MMENWAYGLLAIGILFIIMAMFSLGRTRQRKAVDQITARDHIDRARQKQGVRDELEGLMVDINAMAQDLGAQLDAKVVRIEKALRDSDQRIAQLEALRETLGPLAPGQAPTQGVVQSDEANALGQPDLTADAAPASPHRPPDQADPLTREVYQLADSGLGPQDIAEQLGEHVGKIELILALRNG